MPQNSISYKLRKNRGFIMMHPHPLPIDHRLHDHCCMPPPMPCPPPPPPPHHHHHHHHLPPLFPGPIHYPDFPPPPPPCFPPMTTKVYNAIDVVAGENIEVTLGTVRGMTAFQVSAPLMTAATEDTDGTAGTVPAPTTEDADKYLKSDGTWAPITVTPTVTPIEHILLTDPEIELTENVFADITVGTAEEQSVHTIVLPYSDDTLVKMSFQFNVPNVGSTLAFVQNIDKERVNCKLNGVPADWNTEATYQCELVGSCVKITEFV